ncbi:MAG: RNA polymerase factor sigma-54 [Alphaproteobacteria bacterium]
MNTHSPKISLTQKQSQGPVMTQDLRQAIALLTMPMMDLHAFVQNEVMENPFLQSEDDTNNTLETVSDLAESAEAAHDSERDVTEAMNSRTAESPLDTPLDNDWDKTYDTNAPVGGHGSKFDDDDENSWERTAHAEVSLHDHLRDQLRLAVKKPADLFLGQFLIDAIDDSGYLRMDVFDIAQKLRVTEERVDDILSVIQTFDPAGVGARDLAECLKLQMHAADNLTDAAMVVLDKLELVAKRDYKTLAKLAKVDEQTIRDTIADMTTCNPKPGLQFGRGQVDAVVPDIVVHHVEGVLQADLSAEALPKVLLNRHAHDRTKMDKTAKSYMTDRVNRANWLVKSLEQRARTILKVARVIVTEQADFFTYGAESLKPLTLKQVADVVGVHESTVSRVTTGKFMQTPLGTFELKHFFSAAIGTTGGNTEVAAMSVKAMIKRLIEAEDARKPISDDSIMALLKKEGIDIARRTVAKYREALGIGSSSARRVR